MPQALTGYLWLKAGHPALPGWPCPLRALTGIPCPTCFLTRATGAALRGELVSAVQLHAFGPPVAAALVAWALLSLRQRRLWPRWPGPLAGARAGPLMARAGLALVGYWAGRLALQQGWGWATFPPG